MDNIICKLFGIRYPVIQAGMVWCSGQRRAGAVSRAGGMGLLGAGSMTPEVLLGHIRKLKESLQEPFGVNIPLMYRHAEEQVDLVIREWVPVVFTSAGNPAQYTARIQAAGIKVVHVVSSVRFAMKAEQAGVDGIVAEGFEAGGHNGAEQTTTMALVPLVRKATTLPLIAAGGIATGAGMLAAMALGADGIQVGTRFALSEESSAHPAFKNRMLQLKEGETRLYLQKIGGVRMARNKFALSIEEAENRGADQEELRNLLGKGRAMKGIFEGDLEEGELEIGQTASLVNRIEPAAAIVEDIINGYRMVRNALSGPAYNF